MTVVGIDQPDVVGDHRVERKRIARGDELGAFHLGSTVVLLVADPRLAPAASAGDLVRMGQVLWRRS